MFNCDVYYPLAEKPMLERALPLLDEWVFDCWLNPPTVTLGETYQEDVEDEAEIQVCLVYENPLDLEETSHGHDAMDLVQAFLAGYICNAKRED